VSDAAPGAGIRPPPHPYPPPAVGWYATIVLGFLYWMSLLDRFIISLLINPIKTDLGLTDVQFGVLQGVGFIISFTVFGFIFGALADARDRRKLIFIGVTVWSLASAACGLAQSFWHLLLARLGLGSGEASLNPCATSMISDLFPRERLTFAMSVYSLGATIGSGTALMLGGAIIYWVSGWGDVVLPVIGPVAHWQLVFFIVGLPGLLLAFLVFTFPEPARRDRIGSAPAQEQHWYASYRRLLAFVRGHLRFFLAHYTGFTIAAGVISGCVSWYPVHMMRAHDWNEGRIGTWLGMTLLVAGVIGKFLGGLSVDAMYRRGYRDAQLRWFGSCLLLAGPVGALAATSGSPWAFLGMIGLFTILLTALQACAMSSLNLVTPGQLRGTGVAVYSTVAGLLGGSLGAVLIPVFSQWYADPATAIGNGMATLMAAACPVGGLALFAGMQAMRRAVAESEGAEY